MRLQLVFPGLEAGPVASVEDSPENIALLLVRLGTLSGPSKGDVLDSVAGPSDQGSSEVGDTDAAEASPRSNRRRMVLETLQDLKQSGIQGPTLGQIKQRFKRLFPDESIENLDQVVRDMANKTSRLERLERGTFRLIEQTESR